MSTKQSFDLNAARKVMAAPGLQNRCHDLLGLALDKTAEIELITIATVDGRPFAFSKRGGGQPSRVAALSATLLSVCESLAKEIDGDRVDHATVTVRNGYVVSKRIPDRTGVFTLSLFSRGAINLALTLRTAIDLAQELAVEIDAQAAENA